MQKFKQPGYKPFTPGKGPRKLLPPVRETPKPVLPPVKPKETLKPESLPRWRGILDAAAKGAELPESLVRRARDEVTIGQAVQQAGIDAVSGAAPTVKKDDRWKIQSEARRGELEREALGAEDFQSLRRAGMQVFRPKEGENLYLRLFQPTGRTAGVVESTEDKGRRAVRTLNDADYAQIHAQGNNRYAMENLNYLKPEERAVIEYYAGKGDFGKAGRYLEELDRELNARQRAHDEPEQTAWAKENPFLGTGANILYSFATPAAYFENKRQMLKNFMTGEDVPTDVNSEAFTGIHAVRNTEEGVSAAAREAAQEATGSPFWGGAAEGGARLGLGLGRSTSKLIFGPQGAAIYRGLEQAGESVTSALERGGTAARADALGGAAGGIRAAAGLLPLEHLFSLGKIAPEGVKQFVTAIFKQAALSSGEGVVGFLGEQLADTVIMGEQSEYNALVRALEAGGLEHGDAQAQALLEYWLKRPGQEARMNALTGGVSAAVSEGVGALRSRRGDDVSSQVDEGWADAETIDAGKVDFEVEIGYNQYTKQELEGAYQRAVEQGDISPFIPFDQYERVAGEIEYKLVGTTLPSGDIVEGYSQHFIDRVIGQHAAEDIGRPGMRRGVRVEDILKALENPIRVAGVIEGANGKSYLIFGGNCSISVNPETGMLIQVSPLH